MVLCSQSLYREGGSGWRPEGERGFGRGGKGKEGEGKGERVGLEGDYNGKRC